MSRRAIPTAVAERASAITEARNGRRELAESRSNGEIVRLYWLHGTHEVWVEVYDSELDLTIVIPAAPDRALDAFRDPYLYASGAPRLSGGSHAAGVRAA